MAGNAVTRGVPRQLLQGNNPSVPVIGASQIPTIQYSTGNARALQQFSRDMFSLSNEFEDQLDEKVAAEATTQGAVAGIAGDFELQDYGTIRGRAYNKAAIETFATTIETKSIVQLQELSTKYAADPEGLKTGLENWTKGAAQEMARVDPAAAAVLEQRMIIRGAPAVEAAKDYAFKLTKDQADAALIENEVALRAEIKENANDLFSENPERSRASAQAIGMVQNEYMKIYNATDPVTGRPLYTAEERAKARKDFTSTVMSQATLTWFDGQKDKAGAYMRFVNGDFKFRMNDGAGKRQFQGNARQFLKDRTPGHGPEHVDGLKPEMADRLAAMIDSAPPEIKNGLQIGSGFRSVERQRQLFNASDRSGRTVARPGHSQHNHGKAADLSFQGQRLDKAPQAVRDWVHANAKTFGLRFPMDYEPWHIETQEARGGKAPEDTVSEFNVRDSLPPSALDSLDAEMRQRISFSNTLIDRRDKQEKDELDARQGLNTYEMTARLFGAGTVDPQTGQAPPPLDQGDITAAVRNGLIDPDKGAALSRALATEKPAKSDQATLRALNARLYAGENIYSDVLAAADKLTPDDAAQLLGKNQSLNVSDKGAFNKEQQFQFNLLSDQVAGKSAMDKFDQGKADRAAEAMDEYRRRVLDPENVETPDFIRKDIMSRAVSDGLIADQSKLGRMVRPRFSVPKPNVSNRLDVEASINALTAAFDAKTISEEAFMKELGRLQEWEQVQDAIDAADQQQKARTK